MPLRPTFKSQQNRPNSAIYIGNGTPNPNVNNTPSSATSNTLAHIPPSSAPAHISHHRTTSATSVPPGLPDLPEPPSPVLSNSSAGSGLPSPPATNSTGSGSTGDPSTVGLRRLTLLSDSRTMINGGGETRTYQQQLGTPSRSNSRASHHFRDVATAEHRDYELDVDFTEDLLDEDSTARLRLGDSAAFAKYAMEAASSENVAALARVRSLAERNRQALDKLTSMTRLTSPITPSASKKHSRTMSTLTNAIITSAVQSSSSSQTPSSRSSTSLSSTRSERTRPRVSLPPPVTSSASQEQGLSGSETERESSSLYAHHPNNSSPSLHHYSSDPLSTISSSSSSSTTPHTSSQDFLSDYSAYRAHIPVTPQTMQQQQLQQQRRTDPHSKHHRIASLASASTPYLPSGPRVFQTPPSAPQPLTKTRSAGGASVTGISSSSSTTTSRTRFTTPASSGPQTARDPIVGDVGKSRDSGFKGGDSPKRRSRTGSGGLPMQSPQPLTNRYHPEEEVREAEATRRNTIIEDEKDVARAALAAVAASRSGTSLDMRRRSALPREWEVLDEDNCPLDPITPYRSVSSLSHVRDRMDGFPSATPLSREQRPSIRGGSAESALTTRGPTSAGAAGGRSVINEVLRAVGLSPKRNRRLEKERDTRSFLANGDVFEDRRRNESSAAERRLPIGEFGERRTKMRGHEGENEREAPAGSRSVTSMSLSRYSSRSRSRARTGDDGDFDEEDSGGGSGLQEDVVMRTAPAGLRTYRHTYTTPRDPERDIVHLSSMKEKELGRERDRELITGRSMTSLSKHSAFSTPAHQTGAPSGALTSIPPHQDKGYTAPYSRRYSSHVTLNHTGSTGDYERATSRQSALVTVERTEHARLMVDSLAMFEGHMSRISSSEGSSFNPTHIAELVKTAEGVVASADRLNGFLRAASKDAVEREIDAEVADDVEVSENGGRGGGVYTARDMVQVWRSINADYKESVKTGDELVRGITTFLLGVGKALRDMGTLEEADSYPPSANGGGSAHARSVSMNDEDIIRSTRGASPAFSGGSGSRHSNNATGRRSLDISRKGWEPSPSVAAASNAREEALKRLTSGAPGTRSSSSVFFRERDRDVRYESPVTRSGRQDSGYTAPVQSRSSTALSSRWLLTPREQRAQEQEQRLSRLPLSESEDIVASTSQDTIIPYEPSPSPAPRIRDVLNRTLPPLSIPKPLPSLPSSYLRQERGVPDADSRSISEVSTSTRGHERRKPSNTSITTVRGASPYPAVLNPSSAGATTAVTTHTVSNASPEVTPTSAVTFSAPSREARWNGRTNITFSKPSTESVPTLAGLQQQYEERYRTSAVAGFAPPSTPMSGSETERPPQRQTWGVKAGSKTRMASDGSGRVSLGRAADRSAAASSLVPHLNPTRRERTAVTDLFPGS